jgi:hypothetical protein
VGPSDNGIVFAMEAAPQSELDVLGIKQTMHRQTARVFSDARLG